VLSTGPASARIARVLFSSESGAQTVALGLLMALRWRNVELFDSFFLSLLWFEGEIEKLYKLDD